MMVPDNRNSAGKGNMVFYVIGALCAAVGIYLATITRINLLTGQTSSPYLAVGIPLALIGIAVVVVAQRADKNNLTK
jgi:hypothetical protein